METAESMLLNFDGWLGAQQPDVRHGIDAHLKASGPTADSERRRLASMTAVSERTGLDLPTVNDRWDTIRGGYAEQQGGEWLTAKDDDNLFHGQLVKQATKRRDFRTSSENYAASGYRDAVTLEPEDPMMRATRLAEIYKSQEKMGREDTDKLMASYRLARDRTEAVAAPLRPAAREIGALLGDGKVERFGAEAQKSIESAIDRLAAMPEAHRGLVVAMLKEQAGMGTDTANGTEKAVSAGIRGLVGQLRGFAENTKRAAMLRVQQDLAAGTFLIPSGKSLDAAYRSRLGVQALDILGPLTPGTREATAEERAAMGAMVQKDLTRSDVAAQAVAVMEGTIDPIKAAGLLQEVGINTGTSLGAMAPIMIPWAGVAIAQGGYADQEYQRQRSMGTDPATAHSAAQITGAVQAGVERAAFLFNFVPGSIAAKAGKALTTLGGGVRPALASSFAWQTLGKVASVQAIEYTEEIVQDAVPTFTAALGSALGWTLPEQAQASQEWARWEFFQPDTFFTVAALSIFGGGMSGLRDTVQARAALAQDMADPLKLKALGITPPAAEAIAALPEGDRAAAFRAAYAGRTMDSPEATAARQELAERTVQEATRANAQGETLSKAMEAADVTMERGQAEDGAPVYRVTRGATVTEHASAGAALAAVQDHMGQQDREANGPLLEMLAELDANPLSPVKEGKVTLGEKQTVAEYQTSRAAIMQDETAAPEARAKAENESAAMIRRQQVFEKQFPDKPIDWRAVDVGGQSELVVKEGLAQAVIRVANGESAYTPLEEKTEAEAEAWVRSGSTTWQNLESMIREVEAATGDVYLNGHTAGQDAAQDRLAVKEAYSELAQVHATGKGRAGKAAASGIAEVARMDRKGARMNLRQALATGNVRAELAARLTAHVEWLKAVIGKAVRLNRARREAGGAFALDEFLNKSVGIEQETRHAAGVMEEAARIYTPPTAEQEADGIAFNLNSRAQPADDSKRTVMPDGAELIGPTSFSIRAYHGTPHKVDRFSTEKIGTGEGAQVYGWGLYFAENKAVAEEYQKRLGAKDWKLAAEYPSVSADAAYKAKGNLGWKGSKELAKKEIESELRDGIITKELAAETIGLIETAEGTGGKLYTVDILPNEADFLDWDKTLGEQSEKVKAGLKSVLDSLPAALRQQMELATNEEMDLLRGSRFYQIINRWAMEAPIDPAAGDMSAPQEVSTLLAKAGIPGIKFLDGNSRDGGSGTRNFVIFDDKLVKILEENGQPVESSPSFRLTPVATLDALAAQMAKQTRDPDARRKVYDQMRAAMETLRSRWNDTRKTWNGESKPVIEKRTPKELNKEQAFREAAAFADAEGEIMAGLSADAQAALGMTVEDTSAYQGPLAQRFTGGRFGTPGRIQSRKDALSNASAQDYKLGGELDGAAGLPAMFFGGSVTADNAAQEAYEAGEIAEPTPDALWEALRKELRTQARNKEALTAALATLKDGQKQARAKAKADAAAWRTEQDEMQAKDWDARAVMLRHLRTLDALLSALPPEVRAKVGGWTAIASLKTQPAMQKELEHRLKVADEYLETALKKDALASIAQLLDKARPDREGGKKSKGKLGAAVHRFFDEVERVTELTPAQVEAEQIALDAALVADGVTEAEQADIFEKQQALDMFGALGKPKAHDAAHLTRALDQLEQVYVEGRNRWRMLEEARLAEVGTLAQMTTETLGGPSYAGSQQQKAKAGKLASKLSKAALDLKSFGEVMTALLGPGHPLAMRWTRAAREAFAQKNDSVRALRVRWNAALESATGKRGVEARRILWEMGNPKNQTITASLAGPASMETQAIPIDLIEQWADGSADPAETGITKQEAADLIEARLALEEDDTKQNLPLKREKRGAPETAKLNEAEGVFLTMLAGQEQYTAGLDRAGFDAAAVEQIEEQLSPAAKSLRSFLAKEYQEGYAPLAKVFERMFGVGLPQIKNYAPAAFYNMGTEQAMDPTGSGTIEGGFRAGFLKNRKEHQAAPKLENAFATFFGHANQTAHWKAMAETVREMTGVFNKPEVKRAIESAHGKEMLGAVNQWMKALEGNGLQQQAGVMDGAVRWFTSQQTYIALAWKVGTLFKQSSALLGSAYRMPAGAYLKGFRKLLTGQLDVAAMFNSPVIQRRLETGFAPEVRAAMNDIWSAKPSRRQALLEQGMELIGLVDAIFTTGSAAIAYDYHLAEAKKAGMGDMEAAAVAMQETEDIVGATAQPADVVDRSLFELRQGAFGKLVFLFASEARQKSSLWATAWGNTLSGKGTAADARVLVLAHLILGPAMQAIGAAVRDARNDDDDELFDSTNWDPLDFLKATVAGPLAGLPLIGNAVSGFTDSGVLGRFTMAGKSGAQLIEGADKREDEKAEWYFKRIVRIMQGLDAFTGTLGSVAGQVFDFTDNLHDDETEEAGQAKRARARERKDAKEASKDD